jgi:hypothetical protein
VIFERFPGAIIPPLVPLREGVGVAVQVADFRRKSSAGIRPAAGLFTAFRSNRKYFLIGDSRDFASYASMRVPAESGQKPGTWFIEPNRASTAPLKRPHARARLNGTHVVTVFSLFLVFFTATLLIGGHAAIDPLLQSAAEARDSRSAGDIVYTMPGGLLCRHMSYDNVTGEQTGGSLQPCDSDIVRDRTRSNRHFTWQTN